VGSGNMFCIWSARERAKFCHHTTRRLGGDRPRQNKQTLKYLVDSFLRLMQVNCNIVLLHFAIPVDRQPCLAYVPRPSARQPGI